MATSKRTRGGAGKPAGRSAERGGAGSAHEREGNGSNGSNGSNGAHSSGAETAEPDDDPALGAVTAEEANEPWPPEDAAAELAEPVAAADELSPEAEALRDLGAIVSEADLEEEPSGEALGGGEAEAAAPGNGQQGAGATNGVEDDEPLASRTPARDGEELESPREGEVELDDAGPPYTDPSDEGAIGGDVGASEGGEAEDGSEGAIEDTAAFLKGLIEAILFVADHPLELKDVARAARIDKKRAQELLAELIEDTRGRGMRVEELGGGFIFRTNPQYSAYVRHFLQQRPVRLSRAQLETLAIIAYRQPVTRPEIDEIRGVDSGPVLKGLLERDLIRIIGKKDEPGRPMLYGTTPTFLQVFSLKSLRDLPTLREYTELTDESRQEFEQETGEPAPEGPLSVDPGSVPPPDEEEERVTPPEENLGEPVGEAFGEDLGEPIAAPADDEAEAADEAPSSEAPQPQADDDDDDDDESDDDDDDDDDDESDDDDDDDESDDEDDEDDEDDDESDDDDDDDESDDEDDEEEPRR